MTECFNYFVLTKFNIPKWEKNESEFSLKYTFNNDYFTKPHYHFVLYYAQIVNVQGFHFRVPWQKRKKGSFVRVRRLCSSLSRSGILLPTIITKPILSIWHLPHLTSTSSILGCPVTRWVPLQTVVLLLDMAEKKDVDLCVPGC